MARVTPCSSGLAIGSWFGVIPLLDLNVLLLLILIDLMFLWLMMYDIRKPLRISLGLTNLRTTLNSMSPGLNRSWLSHVLSLLIISVDKLDLSLLAQSLCLLHLVVSL